MTFWKQLASWVIPAIDTNMRSPDGGIRGWLAMKFMEKNSPSRAALGVRRMDLSSGDDIYVELGAGHGFGLRAIGEPRQEKTGDGPDSGGIPKRIVCFEISPRFLAELGQVKEELPYGDRIELYGQDCRDMSFLQDGTVDKIFALNVVYFLDPLPVYLREMHRVLKPGGVVVFGGYFGYIPNSGAFVNSQPGPILSSMEEAGFTVSSTDVFATDDTDKKEPMYIELKGVKK
jgi:SAM-dependent methyltransferase